ncbi:Cell division ATP-binding protein FtsE [termite gut metagenome]|uniref:Cell division ATP-binding protein FtsE n=1 Tax=termite gut metagenome TaxID=433724 RepID=A0A5J4SD76_9ZZZZ
MEKEILIDYQNVEIYQQDICVLNQVDLEVSKGDFIYITGKVGTGKTSLLKTIYGELDATGICCDVLGYNMKKLRKRDIPRLRRRIGIVFQDFQLLTDRTVYDNLYFVLRATGWKKDYEIDSRIEEVLEQVGMSDKGHKIPNELSGGEQQHVVIARAILNSPQIILADEPTGNLDVETGTAILELLYNISKTGTSVVVTTHNLGLMKKIPGTAVYRCEGNHHITNVTEEFV